MVSKEQKPKSRNLQIQMLQSHSFIKEDNIWAEGQVQPITQYDFRLAQILSDKKNLEKEEVEIKIQKCMEKPE